MGRNSIRRRKFNQGFEYCFTRGGRIMKTLSTGYGENSRRGGFSRGGRGRGSRSRSGFRSSPSFGRGHVGAPHPRSLYRGGIDLKTLSDRYPVLLKYITIGDEGKLKLTYSDNKALCTLAKVLAKRDFNLDLELPHDKMVPCLQMRYNYLLWIEDLLLMWPPETRGEIVNGVDIGADASCIYALVAAKKNNWHMLTSEFDPKIYDFALRNISRNGLENLVTLKNVSEDTFLDGVLDPDVPFYDFCMFSPPTFSKKDGRLLLGKVNEEWRNLEQLTGRQAECIKAGGELNLMENIVRESEKFKYKAKIFSCMVSRKSTVDKLGPRLLELVGDDYVATQVFVFGPTRSFGIAWTFDDRVKIKNADRLRLDYDVSKVKIKMEKEEPKDEKPELNNETQKPVKGLFLNVKVHNAFSRIIQILNDILVNFKVKSRNNKEYILEISTYYEFWTDEGKVKAKNWKEKVSSFPETNEDASSSTNMEKIFFVGDTLILSAEMKISQTDDNDVVVDILATDGSLQSTAAMELIQLFKKQWILKKT